MASKDLSQLQEAIISMDALQSAELVKSAIENGVDPVEIVEDALRPSLNKIGKEFEAGNLFLPELVAAGKIATKVGDIVEDALGAEKEIITKATVALGTVKGDIHSIGKNIVAVMMKAYGFKVIDLGVDVSPDEFLEAAPDADVLAMSGLLTTATRSMKEVIGAVSDQLPDKHMITGGAAMNPELANALGVMYGPDAASGVRMLEEVLAN